MVKNEMRLSKLTGKYAQTKGELEDLSDAWLQSLRRKKKVKRKTVKVNTKGDEAAEQKWGPGKVKVDEMDYKMWLLGDLQDKIRAERARAVREVREGTSLHLFLCVVLCWLISGLVCRFVH